MSESNWPRPPLVLIADSHEDGRSMLAILLGAAGYETAECDSGDGTLDHVRQLLPDVLLLATNSRGDSLATVRAVHDGSGGGRTRVVLITGHGDPEYHRRALEAGCEACLLKPVDVEQVINELMRITGTASAKPGVTAQPSSDARRVVEECSNSIESAKAALERARTVSERAARHVERANHFLDRLTGSQVRLGRS